VWTGRTQGTLRACGADGMGPAPPLLLLQATLCLAAVGAAAGLVAPDPATLHPPVESQYPLASRCLGLHQPAVCPLVPFGARDRFLGEPRFLSVEVQVGCGYAVPDALGSYILVEDVGAEAAGPRPARPLGFGQGPASEGLVGGVHRLTTQVRRPVCGGVDGGGGAWALLQGPPQSKAPFSTGRGCMGVCPAPRVTRAVRCSRGEGRGRGKGGGRSALVVRKPRQKPRRPPPTPPAHRLDHTPGEHVPRAHLAPPGTHVPSATVCGGSVPVQRVCPQP
jgi:hypothetical protein